MDLSISPDLDARLCYGVVFLCAVLSARIQVVKRFEALKIPTLMIWPVPNTWLIFLVYLLLPMALFWLMDRMGALNDTSLFSALLIGLAYPAILAGGFGGIKAPAGLDGFLKPLTTFTDTVAAAVNRKLARNEKRFEDLVVGRMLTQTQPGVYGVYDEIYKLTKSSSSTTDAAALDVTLAALDNAKIPDPDLLKEKKSRAIYLVLSSNADFLEMVTKRKEWIGGWWNSPIYKARVVGCAVGFFLALVFVGAIFALSRPQLTLRYHIWRLGKPNNSVADRDRAWESLKVSLADADLGKAAFQSLAHGVRSPSLPVDRVNRFLQLVLLARDQPYYEELLCRDVLEALRVESVDARGRVHQALLYLAQKREEKFDENHRDLATWNPSTGDSVGSLEKKVDQWEAFFCKKAVPVK